MQETLVEENTDELLSELAENAINLLPPEPPVCRGCLLAALTPIGQTAPLEH